MPQHPALRAPDVRQALAQLHSLHHSIFSSRSWQTDQLGSAVVHGQDAACVYAAFYPDADQLVVMRFAELHRRLDPTAWRRQLALPSGHSLKILPVWAPGSAQSPGSTHLAVVAAVPAAQRGGRDAVLWVLRLSDGAHKAYTLATLHAGDDLDCLSMDILWAPAAPLGWPRLAVVSGHAPSQVRSAPCSLLVRTASTGSHTCLQAYRSCACQQVAEQSAVLCRPCSAVPGMLTSGAWVRPRPCLRQQCNCSGTWSSVCHDAAMAASEALDASPAASGCEVVYLACNHLENSRMWSPDGNSLVAVQIDRRHDDDQAVWLFCVSQARLHHLALPFTGQVIGTQKAARISTSPLPDDLQLGPVNTAFSPSSSHLLCLTGRDAAFVDVSSAIVHIQQDFVIAEAWPFWNAVSWGCAYVIAHAVETLESGLILIFLAAGKPARLQLLQRLPICAVVLDLHFAGLGLLCSWIEVAQGSARIRELISGGFTVRGQGRVFACEAATGRRSVVLTEQPTELLTWYPSISKDVIGGFKANFEPSSGLAGCSMVVVGPERQDMHPVVWLRFGV